MDGGAALLQAVRSSNSPLLQHVRVQGNGQGVAALQQDIEELGVHTFDDVEALAETGGRKRRRKVIT